MENLAESRPVRTGRAGASFYDPPAKCATCGEDITGGIRRCEHPHCAHEEYCEHCVFLCATGRHTACRRHKEGQASTVCDCAEALAAMDAA